MRYMCFHEEVLEPPIGGGLRPFSPIRRRISAASDASGATVLGLRSITSGWKQAGEASSAAPDVARSAIALKDVPEAAEDGSISAGASTDAPE